MFTWIVTHQNTILEIQWGTFVLQKPRDLALHLWQSVAHDGACMTVVDITDETYSFFVMEESFRKTNFGQKKIWDVFNIELCVQASHFLDGHIVSGHIDTVGTISEIQQATDGSKQLTISFDAQRKHHLIQKGSIAINGVSLTIVSVWPTRCTVWLIPLTQEITNLWSILEGEQVNLEFDMIGKYILNYLHSTQTDSLPT